MMKVSPAGNRLVFDMIDQYLKKGRLNAYLSDVLMELQLAGTRIDFIDTNGNPYIEIDTPEDYEQAKNFRTFLKKYILYLRAGYSSLRQEGHPVCC